MHSFIRQVILAHRTAGTRWSKSVSRNLLPKLRRRHRLPSSRCLRRLLGPKGVASVEHAHTPGPSR